MEADLHNLYLSVARINQARSNYKYSLFPNTPKFIEWCDFKVKKSKKLAQPRRIARGNFARSIFYTRKREMMWPGYTVICEHAGFNGGERVANPKLQPPPTRRAQ